MCGIAGFSLSGTDDIDPKVLANALLLQIVSRGHDATGVAYVNPAGDKLTIVKADAEAARFINAGGTNDLIPGVRSVIMHTRFATQGDPLNDDNNHPVYQGRIVAVHNGHVGNDDAIFKRLGVARLGEVDSEAIPALLDQTNERPEDILGDLKGGIATSWFDRKDVASLHLARVRSSPLSVIQTDKGSFIFASEEKMLAKIAADLGLNVMWEQNVPEGTLMRIKSGRVLDVMKIKNAVVTPRSYTAKYTPGTTATTTTPAAKTASIPAAKAKTGLTPPKGPRLLTDPERVKRYERLRETFPDASIQSVLDMADRERADEVAVELKEELESAIAARGIRFSDQDVADNPHLTVVAPDSTSYTVKMNAEEAAFTAQQKLDTQMNEAVARMTTDLEPASEAELPTVVQEQLSEVRAMVEAR
jgi:glutamine amidotransferase-like protein